MSKLKDTLAQHWLNIQTSSSWLQGNRLNLFYTSTYNQQISGRECNKIANGLTSHLTTTANAGGILKFNQEH